MRKMYCRCDTLEAVERKAKEAARRVERIAEEGAKRAQRMAEKVEEIVKGVEDRAERFVRSMHRPEFHYGHDTQQGDQPGQAHQTHHQFGNHHHSGPAPATTIYHHYHHGQSAVTDTSTTIVTSTAVTTSTSTKTFVTLTAGTTVVTATTTAFAGSSARPKDLKSEESMFGHVTAGFWFLGFLLLIYSIALCCQLKLENPRDPKIKSSTSLKPRTSSLTELDFDLTDLKPYITTRYRQKFAVTISRMVTALYCLESYWIIKTTWNMYTQSLEDWWDKTLWGFFILTVITFTYLALWYLLGQGFCVVLDLPFTFVSELALMPVSADDNHAPTSKGKRRPKKKAFRGNKQTYKDKQSIGSGSEESWKTDLHG